jgi:SAM-dependent methyltransferase
MGGGVGVLGVLAEVVAGVDTLGCDVRQVVSMLRRAGVGSMKRPVRPVARVVDLGCGRGELAVAIAAAMEAEVVGIDGHAAFVRLARERATAAGAEVAARCKFIKGDVRRLPRLVREGSFDAAVMLNVMPCGPAVKMLRRLVKPGGVYVFDDAMPLSRRGVVRVEEMEKAVAAAGDEVVECRFMSARRLAAARKRLETMRRRVERGGLSDGRALRAANVMVEHHEAALSLLGRELMPVVMMARRTFDAVTP